jgi:hypothetical protein
MALTIPISSDIVNGVMGVFVMICLLPVLEQVRVLAVNQADRLDLARTGSIRVGSRTQVWGKTTKWYGSRVLVLLAAIVVLCSLAGELMFPFSIKGISQTREKLVTAVGSQLVDRATFSRGFNSTEPCLGLTYDENGGEGVMFNRSFVLSGLTQCDQQPYFEFSFVWNRPAGQVAELISIEKEMHTFNTATLSITLVPFEDGSLAACSDLLSTGVRSPNCMVMRPLANGTFQFWIYSSLSTSIANLTRRRRGWATAQKRISRLAVERNWAPLVGLVREIMSNFPLVVDYIETNLTSKAFTVSSVALAMMTLVSIDTQEKKLYSLGLLVRALFTGSQGTFTIATPQDVTEINQTLLGLSIGLAILPSLLFLCIGHMKKSKDNLRVDSGCPKFLAAVAVRNDGVSKLDDSNEMPGNVIITNSGGNLHLEIAERTGLRGVR